MKNSKSTNLKEKDTQEYIAELEDSLHMNETKFNIFYNNSVDMYVAVSPADATIKFCNETLLKKTGYKEDEVVGMPVFKLYHESCIDKVHEAFNEFVSTGKVVNKHLLMKTKDNKKIDVMLNVVSVRDDEGNIIYSTSSWRDITQELKAKQNEIEYEHLLAESQRMAKIGSWKINLSDNSFNCSDEIYNILNIEKENKLKDYSCFLEYVHNEDKEKVTKSFDEFIENKIPYTLEYRIIIENNQIKHIQSSWEAINDENDNLISLIGTVQDISYTKSIQNQLEELNKTLEDKVIKKTQELEQAQEQLLFSEKMAALGSLVAGVAHEINTPIGIGYTGSSHFIDETKLLKKKYHEDTMTKEDFEEYLNTSVELSNLINANLERAVELVKSFKQVAVDQSSEEKRVFNLSKYINEILTSIHSVTKQKNISFNIVCDENLIVDTYAGAFAQIITNLIMNSFIHGFEGVDEGSITLSIEKEDNILHLEYKDTGNGIENKNLDKIFDPFFTTNRSNGSSGLGLNIIYNMIKKKF